MPKKAPEGLVSISYVIMIMAVVFVAQSVSQMHQLSLKTIRERSHFIKAYYVAQSGRALSQMHLAQLPHLSDAVYLNEDLKPWLYTHRFEMKTVPFSQGATLHLIRYKDEVIYAIGIYEKARVILVFDVEISSDHRVVILRERLF